MTISFIQLVAFTSPTSHTNMLNTTKIVTNAEYSR